MGLLIIGDKFTRDLEKHGALGLYAPLEGGFEGRYLRRLRGAGYGSISLTARGLGDLSMYLEGVHGVRPAHLGKQTIGHTAAVGSVVFAPPLLQLHLDQLPARSRGLVVWMIEGFVLSAQEREYLCRLPQTQPRVKVVVEVGGAPAARWQPLATVSC